jgi:hypothetical protein
MRPNFRKYDWRKIKVVRGNVLVFIALWLFLWIGPTPWPEHSLDNFPICGLVVQKAFAGEKDVKEALIDSSIYTDTLIAIDTTAAPGESFWLTVNLTNITVPVAGISFMLTYDTSRIYPVYTPTDPCAPDSFCTLFTIEGHKTSRTQPLSYYFWAGRALNNHIDTLKFCMSTDIFQVPVPYLPAGGSGPVVRFRFQVKPHAQAGETSDIRFVFWDFAANNYANTLIDTLGIHNFIPIVRDGVFTVSGGGPPPIPTLTEWGLIIFGTMLLGFITWVFLRRRKAGVSLQ